MAKKDKFYVTTSIAYTNDKPHIGFALELIQADVFARWNQLKGKEVFFLTGTDEHGVKNERAAAKEGMDVKTFVNRNSARFKKLCKQFNVINNYFIRTTYRKVHWPTAEKIWTLLETKGDLYRKTYSGYYCAGCESFKTKRELVDGKCPNHDKKPEIVEEENWFFRLSKYNKEIEKRIKSGKLQVLPKGRRNEILSLLKQGLDDVSFSRSSEALTWGIPVPGDSTQTMYVWCDALTNYLSGIGYTSNLKNFKKLWPADLHVIGKDILRFHAAIWPGMLLSAGLPLPKSIFVHGFVTAEGKKMSKSIGNVIDPVEQIEKYGVDQIRYYLLRAIPSHEDGDYSDIALVRRIDADLANSLGNLINRALVMVEKYYQERVPKKIIDKRLKDACKKTVDKVSEKIENFELHHALDELWKLVDEANRYINDKKPWEIEDDNIKDEVIYSLLETIRYIGVLLWPFIPEASEKIIGKLGLKKKEITLESLQDFGYLEAGKLTNRGEILFKRVI